MLYIKQGAALLHMRKLRLKQIHTAQLGSFLESLLPKGVALETGEMRVAGHGEE